MNLMEPARGTKWLHRKTCILFTGVGDVSEGKQSFLWVATPHVCLLMPEHLSPEAGRGWGLRKDGMSWSWQLAPRDWDTEDLREWGSPLNMFALLCLANPVWGEKDKGIPGDTDCRSHSQGWLPNPPVNFWFRTPTGLFWKGSIYFFQGQTWNFVLT